MLADLHVHVARAGGRPVKIAASARLTVSGIIEESVRRKGLDAVALVDAHSPPVLAELEGLVASGELAALPGGGLESREGRRLLLLLAAEVEVDEPGVGPVHYLCYLPDLPSTRGFSAFLSSRVTNVCLSSQRARTRGEEIAGWLGREGGFLVPAHIFTPYKGFFGQGGSDLAQVFSDRALAVVPAVELGLSADAAMADLVPALDPFTYLTNSDAHSLETIGREHNLLDLDRGFGPVADGGAGEREGAVPADFRGVAEAIRDGRVVANYGLDPRLGKYHRAFCPGCGFVSAQETASGSRCPSCGKSGLVGGVLDRVLALAAKGARTPDSPAPARAAGRRERPPYVHQVPLRHVPGVGPVALRRLLAVFGTEMAVLHRVPVSDLEAAVGERLAVAITAGRSGTAALDIAPGAGGRYGRVRAEARAPQGSETTT